MILEVHRQVENLRKERKYYICTEAETYKEQIQQSLVNLKKIYKECIKEGCKALNVSWKKFRKHDPISHSDAIEMCATMAILTSSKTGADK